MRATKVGAYDDGGLGASVGESADLRIAEEVDTEARMVGVRERGLDDWVDETQIAREGAG